MKSVLVFELPEDCNTDEFHGVKQYLLDWKDGLEHTPSGQLFVRDTEIKVKLFSLPDDFEIAVGRDGFGRLAEIAYAAQDVVEAHDNNWAEKQGNTALDRLRTALKSIV